MERILFGKLDISYLITGGANLENCDKIHTKKTMKTVVKSYKIRIYPNKSLQDKLYENFGYNRFVFNQLLNYNRLIFSLVVK
ncbi:MAG: helix-turn-helix domain-containing protein [Methanobacteriaceae archaeon]|nr:helix-turn-helix domain-containing protein [Methanobacteriaceae archaeon]